MKKIHTLLFLILLPVLAFAQSDSEITISTSPNVPEPGQRVVLKLESFAINLTDSNIKWFAKNQVIKEGEGATSISFIAPEESVNIAVQVLTPEGDELAKSIIISASSVDLLWEAPDTYSPPFYKGKALPGPESLVKFVAVPSATKELGQSGTKGVDFMWQRNDVNMGSNSGKGKDSYTILLDSLKNSESLNVATNYAGKVASAETVIKPFDLGVSIYPLSSGGEPFITRALRSGDIVNREASFFAAPYSAHPKYLDSKNIKFSWMIGQDVVKPTSRPFLITLVPSDGDAQKLEISYEILKSLFDGFKRTYQIKI